MLPATTSNRSDNSDETLMAMRLAIALVTLTVAVPAIDRPLDMDR